MYFYKKSDIFFFLSRSFDENMNFFKRLIESIKILISKFLTSTLVFSTFMFIIIEMIYFFLFFSFVHCQRYYAFIETLFVIDKQYFPDLPGMTYEEYIQVMVDTTNMVKSNGFILGDLKISLRLLDFSITK